MRITVHVRKHRWFGEPIRYTSRTGMIVTTVVMGVLALMSSTWWVGVLAAAVAMGAAWLQWSAGQPK